MNELLLKIALSFLYQTQEQQIEEDKNTLAPDKLPSSFGGHQAAVAGTSTKKHACKNR